MRPMVVSNLMGLRFRHGLLVWLALCAAGTCARGQGKLTLVAAGAAAPAAKKTRTVKAGSAQAKAAEHPMVVEAQRLFDAEIQSVIDLSGQE